MNPIRRIRRLTAAPAGLACAWLGLAFAAPVAFAGPVPTPGSGSTALPEPAVQVQTVMVGGMAGWQITLIAIGAALAAAAVAVLLDRRRTARRKLVSTPA